MDVVLWLVAELRALEGLAAAAGAQTSPTFLLAPLAWWLGRVLYILIRGLDLRRTLNAMPSDARSWETRGFGRHVRVRRFGPRSAGPPAPHPAHTWAVSPEAFLRRFDADLDGAAQHLAGAGDPDHLVAEAAFVVFDRWRTMRGGSDDDKLAYLYRVMRNEATTGLRRRGVFARYARRLWDGSTQPSAEDEYVRRRRARLARTEVRAALDALPPQSRRVMELHLEGWSNQEIALETGKRESAVGTCIWRAKRAVATRISPELRGLLTDMPEESAPGTDQGGE